MKSLLIACVLMFAGAKAHAWACNLQSCTTSLTVDAGKVGKRCSASSASCSCVTAVPSNCDGVIVTSCPGGFTFFGNTVNGQKCCYGNCVKADETSEQVAIEEEILINDSNEVSDVFENEMGTRVTTYYGYVDGANRSPFAGRGNSVQAKLDACLFHSDTDQIESLGGTMADKLGRCYGSTYGCGTALKNEHCNATGTNDGVSGVTAAVCKDRCDCLYGGNCDNL